MAGGHAHDEPVVWPLEPAWDVAVKAVSAAYRVDPNSITAESRGRGPRPPEAIREPKKVAIYLAVTLTGCDYAALGRHVGLHKDTVTSHCAWAREACAGDAELERRVEALGSAAIVLLEIAGAVPTKPKPPTPPAGSISRTRLHDLQDFMDGVFEAAFKSLTDEETTFIRRNSASSDANENIFQLAGTRRARA